MLVVKKKSISLLWELNSIFISFQASKSEHQIYVRVPFYLSRKGFQNAAGNADRGKLKSGSDMPPIYVAGASAAYDHENQA